MDNPLQTAQAWLQEHSTSKHTHRKYDAQLQQLCEWMLLRGLDFPSIEAAELEEYLGDVASGAIALGRGKPGIRRSAGTVALTRSVLRSLFKALVLSGHRATNPVDRIKLPTTSSAPPSAATSDDLAIATWADARPSVVLQAQADQVERSALIRAFTIAELAYWAGLRRSELAAGAMGDFTRANGKWRLLVKRFGRGPGDTVYVPAVAMAAVSRYRLNRGLTLWPSPSERDVPLISRLRAEHSVDPWTVASALKTLNPSTAESHAKLEPQSIVALRRELVSDVLKVKALSAHHLSLHVRSKYLVDQVSERLPSESVSTALERLAA